MGLAIALIKTGFNFCYSGLNRSNFDLDRIRELLPGALLDPAINVSRPITGSEGRCNRSRTQELLDETVSILPRAIGDGDRPQQL
jgi:hypothetical protein